MRLKYKGSLQRTMIIYFLMISFASSMIGAEFILDVQKKELRSELMQNFEKLSNSQMSHDEALKPIDKIRNKAILMIGLLLIVVIILLTMFIKNITGPLQHMIEISRLIAIGDLSQTVNIDAKNELAEMGSTVNELTTNLQEMILLSRDMCATSSRLIKEIENLPSIQNIGQSQSAALKQEMDLLVSKTKLLDNIIVNCKFYGIEK